MLLLITLLGPIRFLGGTANALKWAHCISRCCYQLLCFGQLYFWKVLPMYSDGPITLADAAANYFTLAHYICGRHCQFTQMGAAADGFDLAYYFLGGTANPLRWAHCIGDAAAYYLPWAHKIFWRPS